MLVFAELLFAIDLTWLNATLGEPGYNGMSLFRAYEIGISNTIPPDMTSILPDQRPQFQHPFS
ncbi:hypothetical protein, partial [Methanomethylovorans sp.]|uniref:hypothetical protein n=1 Tax=Methanomethylovorans sp. TaxID=2758717 RepID=UPI003D0A9F01